MSVILAALLFFQTLQASPLLENAFVRVYRNSAPCAGGAASCGDRVLVALGTLELSGQKMERGDVKVFKTGEPYSPTLLPTVVISSKWSLSLGIQKRSPQAPGHLLHPKTKFYTMEKNSQFLRRKWSLARKVPVTVTTNAWQSFSIKRKCSSVRMGNRKPGPRCLRS